jgi:3-hydroxyisobutyrate dehydrogenase-like beta-hydroxyacid dehydrogenase
MSATTTNDRGSATAATPAAGDCVGLIGLGLMGTALAERFSGGKLRVLGYDLDARKRHSLGDNGGNHSAEDAAGVFAGCDRVVLSLPTSDIVRRVLRDATASLRAGQLLIDTTTGSPDDAAELGRQLAGRGIEYVDATVSGSSEQVRAREAIVMVGGEAAAIARSRDLFGLFARRTFHVGPWGGGATMKLVTNLVLGLNRAALAEGLAFAKALDLDLGQTMEVLRDSMAYSRIMDTKAQKMINAEFSPQAKLSQHLKDVRLMLEAGGEVGARLPLTDAHRALLEAAEAAGYGELDNSALIRAFDPAADGESDRPGSDRSENP